MCRVVSSLYPQSPVPRNTGYRSRKYYSNGHFLPNGIVPGQLSTAVCNCVLPAHLSGFPGVLVQPPPPPYPPVLNQVPDCAKCHIACNISQAPRIPEGLRAPCAAANAAFKCSMPLSEASGGTTAPGSDCSDSLSPPLSTIPLPFIYVLLDERIQFYSAKGLPCETRSPLSLVFLKRPVDIPSSDTHDAAFFFGKLGSSRIFQGYMNMLCEAAGRPEMMKDNQFWNLVDKVIEVASAADDAEINLSLMRCFFELELQAPVKRVGEMIRLQVTRLAQNGITEEVVAQMVVALSYLGDNDELRGRFLEFCESHLFLMNASCIALYIRECSKRDNDFDEHLYRCIALATEKAYEMNLNEMLMVAHTLIPHCAEFISFFLEIAPLFASMINKMDRSQLLLVLHISAQFHSHQIYNTVQNLCAGGILSQLDSMSSKEFVTCLRHMQYDRHCGENVKALLHRIMHKLGSYGNLDFLTTTDAVTAIECFASWGFRILLYNKLGDKLAARKAELKSTVDTYNWLAVFSSFAKADWYHSSFVNVICAIARDESVLERMEVFQQTKLLGCFARLHHYEADIYDSLAIRITAQFTWLTHVRDISPVVWAFANACHIYEPLFDAAYEAVANLIRSKSLDMSIPAIANSVISLCWSFVVSKHHLRYSFPCFLDYAFFERTPDERMGFKRLHQVADACFFEAPEVCQRCQYMNAMIQFCQHQNCVALRDTNTNLKHDKDATMLRQRSVDELASIVVRLNMPYEIGVAPDFWSPYTIDVCVDSHKKIGIHIQGRDKLMRTGQAGRWIYRNTGTAELQKRMLSSRGWTTAFISLSEWLHLVEDERRSLVIKTLNDCCSGAAMKEATCKCC